MVLFVVAPKSNFRKIDRHFTPNWSAANIGAGMLALYWLSLIGYRLLVIAEPEGPKGLYVTTSLKICPGAFNS